MDAHVYPEKDQARWLREAMEAVKDDNVFDTYDIVDAVINSSEQIVSKLTERGYTITKDVTPGAVGDGPPRKSG